MVSTSVTPPRSGVYYFSQGWKLITLPGIRRFVIMPLLVNIILIGCAFVWLFTQLDSWIPALMSHAEDAAQLAWSACRHSACQSSPVLFSSAAESSRPAHPACPLAVAPPPA